MAEERVESRLVAILAADVVGYSALVEQDEAGTLAALTALMCGLILPSLAQFHGRVVKTMGDGCIAEFSSVVDAVRCAVAIQRGSAERTGSHQGDKPLDLRIGVNLGDVVVDGADLYGDGVNIAARLEQLAEPGGVLISGAAYDHLQGKLDVPLEFFGDQQLKNIARPVRTYRIRLDGTRRAPSRSGSRKIDRRTLGPLAATLLLAIGLAAWGLWPHGTVPGLAGRASLAILPFMNIAGDEATGRLADGLTEDIITDLSRYRNMDVTSHNSTERYKSKAVDVRQVGKELNVRYVLEGSVQRDGDQLRVTAQLIDAASDAHLWSERWDKPSKDFFAVQSDIASQLGNRLGEAGVIDKAEQEAAHRSRPDNFSAYELYLLGRSEALRMSADGNAKALELFEKAVAADPRLARAWADLAYTRQNSTNYGGDPGTVGAKALAEARRAVEIDPSDAGAHATLGYVLAMRGDFGPSEAEFDTALRLNPGDADILAEYSGWASAFGRVERGAQMADHAIRLNPNYQVWQGFQFSWAYFSVGRFEDALRIPERLPKEKYQPFAWVMLAASYAALGREPQAKATVADMLAKNPDLTIEGFTGTADWSDADRKRLIGPMRAAGFPPCAKPEILAKNPQLVRLPECVSK
jgi:TolB-like protein/class 3 adenylate cyclase